MEIMYDTQLENIKKKILDFAIYQKVVLLYDFKTDKNLMNNLINGLEKKIILFECNVDKSINCKELIQSGTRLVLSFLSCDNFINVSDCFDNVILIDFLSDEIYPHLGVNVKQHIYVITSSMVKKELDYLYVCNVLIESKWQRLLSSQNYNDEEWLFDELKNYINNGNNNEKYLKYLIKINKLDLNNNCKIKNNKMFQIIKLISIKYLFLGFYNKNYNLIDFYKLFKNNYNQINIIYNLINNERIKFILNNYNKIMLDFLNKIFNCLNNKMDLSVSDKEEVVDELKFVKEYAKNIESDSLIKLAYLYGVFEAV